MGASAYCVFCFEVLAAELEKRRPLTLKQVEEYWAEYGEGSDVDGEADGQGSYVDGEQHDKANNDAAHGLPNGDSKQGPLTNGGGGGSSSSSSSSNIPVTEEETSGHPSSSSSLSSPSPTPNGTGTAAAAGKPAARPTSRHAEFPLFVTWNIARGGAWQLRGCIGTFEPRPVATGLAEYALISALEDTRFAPVDRRELPLLQCGLTLLHSFTPAADPLDWTVGRHGIRIAFSHDGRRYGSTYLPDVALEQGWSREQALASLIRKAGCAKMASHWRRIPDLKLTRYEGFRSTIDFTTWREWRLWVSEEKGV